MKEKLKEIYVPPNLTENFITLYNHVDFFKSFKIFKKKLKKQTSKT